MFVILCWQALRLADPEKQGYIVRWPILGSRFNTRDYPSVALIVDDIETILETSLQDSFGISRRAYKVFFLFRTRLRIYIQQYPRTTQLCW